MILYFYLFEIVLEMIELEEVEVARVILRQTGAMKTLQEDDHDRWARLDSLLNRTHFQEHEVSSSK